MEFPKKLRKMNTVVGLIPTGVRTLREHGHNVLVEAGAGTGCTISDREYVEAGAEIVESPGEVYRRADMIMKVKEPLKQE